MSDSLKINGVTLLNIKDASKTVSYSKDYISRLAREQKIIAAQVQGQWFVDILSLKNFVEVAELEKKVKQQKTGADIKRDLDVREEVLKIKKDRHLKIHHVDLHAKTVALVALCLGSLSGIGFGTTMFFSDTQTEINNFSYLNAGVSDDQAVVAEDLAELPPLNIPEAQEFTVLTEVTDRLYFAEEIDIRYFDPKVSGGILLLPKGGKVESLQDISEMFSDDLTISFTGDNSGVISFNGEESDQQFPFVYLPAVKEQGEVNEIQP